MPATLETWVANANGEAIFAVMAPPSASTAAKIRRLLPDLRSLIGEDRRTTIVFDRGGWSPEVFAEIIDANFDLLTYRKGDIEPEPDDAFADYVWIDERGVEHHWKLADRQVELELSTTAAKSRGSKTITLRQIVRQSADGHQTHILTTRMDLPAEQIAARMFNRWRQENYFRYAREHFALDALDSYTVVEDDLTRTVPNPAKAASQQRTKALEQTSDAARDLLGDALSQRNLRGTVEPHTRFGRLPAGAPHVPSLSGMMIDRYLAAIENRQMRTSKLRDHAPRCAARGQHHPTCRLTGMRALKQHQPAAAALH